MDNFFTGKGNKVMGKAEEEIKKVIDYQRKTMEFINKSIRKETKQ